MFGPMEVMSHGIQAVSPNPAWPLLGETASPASCIPRRAERKPEGVPLAEEHTVVSGLAGHHEERVLGLPLVLNVYTFTHE